MAISKTISKAVAKKFNAAIGMKGFPPNVRSRNLNGALRRVRGDKLIKTVRQQFQLGAESLAGHSGNMKLGTLRKMRGVTSEKAVLKGVMGLKGGRSVNANGAIHGKRADTLLKTIRKEYGRSAEAFGGHSGQMQLGTIQEKRGISSVSDLLKGVFGLKGGRSTNANGQIRGKRADTLLKTVREQYGRSAESFGGHSGQMQLGTIQEKRGISSVKDLLEGVMGFKGGRARTASGAVRAKRGDTLARTLEKQYSVQFPGRNDKHLATLRKELGADSIKDLLAKVRP